jgi:hypothetical protein
MIRRTLFTASAAGLAAPVFAQTPSFTSDTTISMPLFWSEVNGNNNGILEPGESAEIRMDVSFTNQFGVAHFAPPIGTFSSGTIMGFGGGFLDLSGSGGASGAFFLGNNPLPQTNNGTTGYGVRSGWRIVGSASPGSVNAAGTGVTEIQFGDFAGPPGFFVTTNPISRMYAILWTPADYSGRQVTFAAAGHSSPTASIAVDLSGGVNAPVFVDAAHLNLGSITIPIAPAPPAAAALTFLALARRRRRGASP